MSKVVANVRRSALIAIGDCKDREYLRAKRWDLGGIPNYRAFSNNSVVCNNINEIINDEDFWAGYYGNGEPYGLINLKLSRRCGRTGETQYQDPDVQVYNPCGEQSLNNYETCVTGDTLIHTRKGCFPIRELVGCKMEIFNGEEWSLVEPFVAKENDTFYKIVFNDGSELSVTAGHEFSVRREGDTEFRKLKTTELSVDMELPDFKLDTEHIEGMDNSIAGIVGEIYSGKYGDRTIEDIRKELFPKECPFCPNHPCESNEDWKDIKDSRKHDVLPFFMLNLTVRSLQDFFDHLDFNVRFSPTIAGQIQILARRIGKRYKIVNGLLTETNEPQRIVSITKYDKQETSYCFTEDKRHMGVFGNVLTYQCCLSEIFLPNINTKEELFTCARYLYRICKHSLALPCRDSRDTERVVHKNMRMGIGVTGYLQASDNQRDWLKDCYEMLRDYDVEYSRLNGFPTSRKLTTCKPSGTLSLLGGCTSGVHPGFAQYYIRRIRISSESPLIKLAQKHGYPTEYVENFDGTIDHSTMIISFPYRLPEGTVLAKDCSAVSQLEWVKKLQREWSDNSVSCTVYYRKEELPIIKEWLRNNYNDNIKTVSFLLHSDHGFKQAPLEEISREQYEKLANSCQRITDVTGICFHAEDLDLLSQNECSGGVCPIR